MSLSASRNIPFAYDRYIVQIVLSIGLAASLGVVWLLTELHEEISDFAFRWIDRAVPNAMHLEANHALTRIMLTLTTIGSPLVVCSMMVMLTIWMVLAKRRGEAIGLIMSEVGALILNQVSKTVFHRDRPDPIWALVHERSYSFPSGHAMLGMVSFGTIAYLIIRHTSTNWGRWIVGTLFGLLIAGIGISRVYLGAHYPSDIIAGWLAGGVWLGAIIAAVNILHRVDPELHVP